MFCISIRYKYKELNGLPKLTQATGIVIEGSPKCNLLKQARAQTRCIFKSIQGEPQSVKHSNKDTVPTPTSMHVVSKQLGERLCLALNVGAANTTDNRCNLHLSETRNTTRMCREVLGILQRQACQRKTKT